MISPSDGFPLGLGAALYGVMLLAVVAAAVYRSGRRIPPATAIEDLGRPTAFDDAQLAATFHGGPLHGQARNLDRLDWYLPAAGHHGYRRRVRYVYDEPGEQRALDALEEASAGLAEAAVDWHDAVQRRLAGEQPVEHPAVVAQGLLTAARHYAEAHNRWLLARSTAPGRSPPWQKA